MKFESKHKRQLFLSGTELLPSDDRTSTAGGGKKLFNLFFTLVSLGYICFGSGCQAPSARAGGEIWYFNFAPADAPDFEPFIRVSGESVYSKNKGYGWIDAEGALRKGRWESGDSNAWEARENLNLVCRTGPDDLARSFFAGPATFALDLEPGKYEIWVLTGDSGYKEYVPHEPYEIVAEGVTVYRFDMGADFFYRQFETPTLEDELTIDSVWHLHVAPRFRWVRAIVDVADGQLTLRVAGGRRDTTTLDFSGDYALTEMRGGPADRFTGALNALVVMRAAEDRSVADWIRKIDGRRQENFAQKWPMEAPKASAPVGFTAADHERGYTLFFPGTGRPVSPGERPPHVGTPLALTAAAGERVPITFGVCPLKNLGPTRVGLGALRRLPDGRELFPGGGTPAAFGVVRYAARPAGPDRKAWRPAPAMIVPAHAWNILGGVAKQFWLTCEIPQGAAPGRYRGGIRISPENAPEAAIAVEIEILPVTLRRPTHIAVGMTYFSPVQYSYFGEERFWKRMQAEFKDMRAHGMTCVQFAGIRMDDTPRLDRAFQLYRAAGFENPVYLLESHGAMWRLRRAGVAWDTDEFQVKYARFIGQFLEEAKERKWPPIVINFGDEFTNKAAEELGARVARSLKAIPGIITGADANGLKEVMLMAPEVDILAFSNGWDGPAGVNRGRRLLNKETVDLVRRAGAVPWLVNVGTDRFSNGFWLWKMVRLGVRGKIEWIYRAYNGMPFNSFDAEPMNAPIVYPGPDGTSIPSPDYEQMRLGLDDLAYLYTLEQAIEEARGRDTQGHAVAQAEAFLRRLADSIDDDLNKYADPRYRDALVWPTERYDLLRREAIGLTLELQERQPSGA